MSSIKLEDPDIAVTYVGDLGAGRTSLHRMRAMESLVQHVCPINTGSNSKSVLLKFFLRANRRLKIFSDASRVNEQIIQAIKSQRIDLLWLDKPLTIYPETIDLVRRNSPKTLIVAFSPDDMSNPQNVTRHHENLLPSLDLYFTTKSYNVGELKDRGCPEVSFIENGYSETIHTPISLSMDEQRILGARLGFIGGYEKARFDSLVHSAKNRHPSKIRGSFWNKAPFRHADITILPGDILEHDYSRAVSATDINLGFLRKCNRDLQTTRSVEIPACGGFMLAERTEEHLLMFTEGIEADYFETDDELVDKLNFYRHNVDIRRRIAIAGYERCKRSGYGNISRMLCMLNQVAHLRKVS